LVLFPIRVEHFENKYISKYKKVKKTKKKEWDEPTPLILNVFLLNLYYNTFLFPVILARVSESVAFVNFLDSISFT